MDSNNVVIDDPSIVSSMIVNPGIVSQPMIVDPFIESQPLYNFINVKSSLRNVPRPDIRNVMFISGKIIIFTYEKHNLYLEI